MYQVLVVGGGKIGSAIAEMLTASGAYKVSVADRSKDFMTHIQNPAIRKIEADVANEKQLLQAMHGTQAVLSALPYALNPLVARAAAQAGAHYFDLTEDVTSTRTVKQLAEKGKTAFVPQCGLAPGFIGIAAHHLSKNFDQLHRVSMRVGALPQFPVNRLKYTLTWSTDGLINEYCNPCEAIENGKKVDLPPLEGLETFALDGVEYEAFNTSGGLGTLCDTLAGRVQFLNYKTIRYPGHQNLMQFLLQDLRLQERRDVMKNILENAIPNTHQDVVLVFVNVTGIKGGKLWQETYSRKIYAKEINGKWMSAIQITTAAGACAMIDLHREGKLPAHGFIRQEDANLDQFLANRFGKHYAV